MPLALMWILWKVNRRAFDGIENDYARLRNSLSFLVSFLCTHEVPTCIRDRVSFVENNIIMYIVYSIYLVYYLYIGCFPIIYKIICFIKKKKQTCQVKHCIFFFLMFQNNGYNLAHQSYSIYTSYWVNRSFMHA